MALPRRLKDIIEVQPNIVNGTDARIEEFPFMVSLQYSTIVNVSYHYCGGSILSEFWVLTVRRFF